MTLAIGFERGFDVELDDRPARRLSVGLGLPVIGTLGILVRAKDAGIFHAIRSRIDALLAADF